MRPSSCGVFRMERWCARSRGTHGFVRSVSFSPDGSLLASGSGDKTIKLWRVADGSLVRTLTGHTNWVWRQMVRAVRRGGVDLTGHTNWRLESVDFTGWELAGVVA
jgi:WD40 repeat protein